MNYSIYRRTEYPIWAFSLVPESIHFLMLTFSFLWPILKLAFTWVFPLSMITLVNGYRAQDKVWSTFIYESSQDLSLCSLTYWLIYIKTLSAIPRTCSPPLIKWSIGAFRCLILIRIHWKHSKSTILGAGLGLFNAIKMEGWRGQRENGAAILKPEHKSSVWKSKGAQGALSTFNTFSEILVRDRQGLPMDKWWMQSRGMRRTFTEP